AGAPDRGAHPLARLDGALRRGHPIQEHRPPVIGVDELGPADLARLVALVEERSDEVAIVVGVADDETVFGRPDRAADERRKLLVDRLADARADGSTKVLVVPRRAVLQAHPGRAGR